MFVCVRGTPCASHQNHMNHYMPTPIWPICYIQRQDLCTVLLLIAYWLGADLIGPTVRCGNSNQCVLTARSKMMKQLYMAVKAHAGMHNMLLGIYQGRIG